MKADFPLHRMPFLNTVLCELCSASSAENRTSGKCCCVAFSFIIEFGSVLTGESAVRAGNAFGSSVHGGSTGDIFQLVVVQCNFFFGFIQDSSLLNFLLRILILYHWNACTTSLNTAFPVSEKSRRKRYAACDDMAEGKGFEPL